MLQICWSTALQFSSSSSSLPALVILSEGNAAIYSFTLFSHRRSHDGGRNHVIVRSVNCCLYSCTVTVVANLLICFFPAPFLHFRITQRKKTQLFLGNHCTALLFPTKTSHDQNAIATWSCIIGIPLSSNSSSTISMLDDLQFVVNCNDRDQKLVYRWLHRRTYVLRREPGRGEGRLHLRLH